MVGAIPTQGEEYRDGSSGCKGIDIGGIIGQTGSPRSPPRAPGQSKFAQKSSGSCVVAHTPRPQRHTHATVEAPRGTGLRCSAIGTNTSDFRQVKLNKQRHKIFQITQNEVPHHADVPQTQVRLWKPRLSAAVRTNVHTISLKHHVWRKHAQLSSRP